MGKFEKYPLQALFGGDQLYLTGFYKLDKLKQKERNALNRKFPSSIKLSNPQANRLW